MSYERRLPIAGYDPSRHTEVGSDYPGEHILDGFVPLSAIVFRPDDDEFAPLLGTPPRSADTCPADRESIMVSPQEPRILYHAPRQRLAALCPQLIRVEGTEIGGRSKVYFGVCLLKAMEVAPNIEALPQILGTAEKNSVTCPFFELNGRISDGHASVDVVVTVRGIDDDAAYVFDQD